MPTVDVIVKTVEQGAENLGKVKDSLNGIKQSAEDLNKKTTSMREQFKNSWTEMNSAVSLVQKGLQIAKGAYDEIIGSTVAYAASVRDLSNITGLSAEETSRLIQVTDDHKISVEALTMATTKLSKDGLSPTLDSLAALSDEYMSLGSSADKTRFLIENFGKTGLQMAELMAMGGERIKEEWEGVAGALVLDQAALDSARDYEMAVDELGDTYAALKQAVGQKALPILIELITKFAQSAQDPGGLINRELTNLGALLDISSGKLSVIKTQMSGLDMEFILGDTQKWNTALEAARAEFDNMGYDGFKKIHERALEIYADLVKMESLGTSGADQFADVDEFSSSLYSATGALEDNTGAVENNSQAYVNGLLATEGYLTGLIDFVPALTDTTASLEAAKLELQEIEKTRPWDLAGIDAAKTKVQELQAAVESQTQAFINSMVQQQLALGGFTAAEQVAYLGYLGMTGQISQDAYDAAVDGITKADEYVTKIGEIVTKADEAGIKIEDIPLEVLSNFLFDSSDFDEFYQSWYFWYTHQGGSDGSEGGGSDTEPVPEAGGGSFSGWAMVGDAPGGKKTPYTEYVYAPGGATVYNQAQMAGKSAPPMAGGGTIPPISNEFDYDRLAMIVRDAVLLVAK